MDTRLKKEAEAVFKEIGIDATTAVRMFYKKVAKTRSIPFPLLADHDERLERLLLEGLASPSSPLEDDWLAGMKRKLNAGLKTAKTKANA